MCLTVSNRINIDFSQSSHCYLSITHGHDKALGNDTALGSASNTSATGIRNCPQTFWSIILAKWACHMTEDKYFFPAAGPTKLVHRWGAGSHTERTLGHELSNFKTVGICVPHRSESQPCEESRSDPIDQFSKHLFQGFSRYT